MRYFLLILIRVYWILIPKQKRKRCLFKKSCSNYVYEETKSKGLVYGLKTLKYRIENCNPNYIMIEVNDEILLISKTNTIFKREELNQSILNK